MRVTIASTCSSAKLRAMRGSIGLLVSGDAHFFTSQHCSARFSYVCPSGATTGSAIGILINAYLFNWVILLGERLFARVPVVKTLFGAVQDAVELFEVKKEKEAKKAVAVELDNGIKLVGFMTSEKVANKLFPGEDKVAVYLPLSYQIGGYTIYLERDRITPLDIDVETAMRIAVTGGNSIEKDAK